MSNVNIEEEDGFFWIEAPYDEDFKDDLKSDLKARWDPEKRMWKVDVDAFTIRDVEAVCKLHFPRAFR
jgi:hypothetical protein